MWQATEENIQDSVIRFVEARQPNIWLEVFDAYDAETVYSTVDHMADFYRSAVKIIHAKHGAAEEDCDAAFAIAMAKLRDSLKQAMRMRDAPFNIRSNIRLKYSRDSGKPDEARIAMYCQTELRSDIGVVSDETYRFKEKIILTPFFLLPKL